MTPSSSSAPSPRIAIDNKALLEKGGKLSMPVLAIGAEKSFNTAMAEDMRLVATNVTAPLLPNPAIVDGKQPAATVAAIRDFSARSERIVAPSAAAGIASICGTCRRRAARLCRTLRVPP